jgi:hypothetical protein
METAIVGVLLAQGEGRNRLERPLEGGPTLIPAGTKYGLRLRRPISTVPLIKSANPAKTLNTGFRDANNRVTGLAAEAGSGSRAKT